MKRAIFLALGLLSGISSISNAQEESLDNFETSQNWKTIAAEDVLINTAIVAGRTENCIKIDFKFLKGSGYCGIQKQFPKKLPSNYQFTFYVKADAPVNNFEFKLLDESGENVWWVNRKQFEFPKEWQKITVKKRHIEFAWGPTGDKNMSSVDKIEFTIASATGGSGSVYLDDFKFEELGDPDSSPIEAILAASSSLSRNQDAKFAADKNVRSKWRSAKQPEKQYLIMNLQRIREYGGLVIDWDEKNYAEKYNVHISDDSTEWESVYAIDKGKGGRSYINLNDVDSKYIRLELVESSRKEGYEVNEIAIKGVGYFEHPNDFFTNIARDKPRGFFPKYLYDEASYWTISGVNRDTKEALINEEGMVEVDKGRFSIEPFIYAGDRFINWNDVRLSQNLEQDYLPIPSVVWEAEKLRLQIKIFAAGEPGSSMLYLMYRLKNTSEEKQTGNFYLAVRPFQVNPSYQFLNLGGGMSRIESIKYVNDRVQVDDKVIIPLSEPTGFGALEFDQGDITDFISRNTLPVQTEITDHVGYASGTLMYQFELSPSQEKQILLAIPFYENYPDSVKKDSHEETIASVEETLATVKSFWDMKTGHVKFDLPPSGNKLINTIRSNLAYILINRDNAGIQPGSRSYERSWIRDGSMTSSALLKMGIRNEVGEFLNWYGQYQYDSGKIPCVVDTRGPDAFSEHDSHSQFVYGILQYYQFTGDKTLLKSNYEKAVKAIDYQNFLVTQRTTAYYKNGNDSLKALYGILPESASHEGYAADFMHSYWDDFFAMKGLKDIVTISNILGEHEQAVRFAVLRDTFRKNLYQSIDLAIKYKGIDYIPGCVELGDFDATSTTIALTPCNEFRNLPQPFLSNTFDKQYQYFRKRLQPEFEWLNYTPYELRLVGSFIYLNQPERAHELLEFYFADQRPQNWNHWAEVVWRDPGTAKFIGDMPHTWVGSDFINAVRSMFVYEDELNDALVVGAGLYADWVDTPAGMGIADLPTYYGSLDYSIYKTPSGYRIVLGGDLKVPDGAIKLRNFKKTLPRRVLINGKLSTEFDARFITVAVCPAEIEIEYETRE